MAHLPMPSDSFVGVPAVTVGFSDYVEYYEVVRKVKNSATLASQLKMSLIGSNHSDTTKSDLFKNDYEERRPFHSKGTTIPKFSYARGRAIKVMEEYLNSRRLRKNIEESVFKPTQDKQSGDQDSFQPGIDSLNLNASSGDSYSHSLMSRSDGSSTEPSDFGSPRSSDNLEKPTQFLESGNVLSSREEKPISCIPVGMLVQQKPKYRPQPVFYSSNTAQKYYRINSTNKFKHPLPKKLEEVKFEPKLPSIKRQLPPTATFHNSTSKALGDKTLPTEICEKSFIVKNVPASSNNLIRSPERKHDSDMKELLDLATAAIVRSSSVEESTPFMLKLSKLAELIEEGRVLVHSDIPHSSTHKLRDFPFESLIYEGLQSFVGCEKPKTIQAYVWEPILRGHDVLYIAGARAGKTLGYLVPILNNLLDPSGYSGVPKGCSPLVVVICSSWENAEMVNNYCFRMMKKVTDFRSAVFADCSPRSLQFALPNLINGITLLATTAPAMKLLLEEGKGVIGFDRCCHLVFDDTDYILRDHGEALKFLFSRYQESVRRMNAKDSFIPRQIVACGSHWTKGVEVLSSKAMNNPSIFISSCMEAAIYGGMKLVVRQGTPQQMDMHLLEIMKEVHLKRTIIFCRGSAEVFKVEKMLSQIGLSCLLAHNQSIISDLEFLTMRWNSCQPGSSILICTDDVLERLDIKNAQALIHYFIPHHSKYDFSYRLSFAMESFKTNASDAERPETYLLLTKEFNNSLLTIVRFMRRFGYHVSDELATEAILSFCGKEARKKNLPLCETLKAFGHCRNMKFCGLRHVILNNLDSPTVPPNGTVKIRITAVRTATRYFARILKHRNENGQVVDMSGTLFVIGAQLRDHFKNGNGKSVLMMKMKVEVGQMYALRTTPGLFERVRIESIVDRDHQGNPVEVAAEYLDQGCIMPCFVHDLFDLPENLKSVPPQATEIFLVGAQPLDRSTTWSRCSIDFVRERLINKELDGRIVLSLSSTLWLQPLHERKRLEGLNSWVVVGDIFKDLLEADLVEKNPDHVQKLYHLCETGGIELPNYKVGLKVKTEDQPVEAAYAFLTINDPTEVEATVVESPSRFYLNILKFQQTLRFLEEDIQKNMSLCKSMTYENALEGTLCLAVSPEEQGMWCRCRIIEKIPVNNEWEFRVFYVDYGDYSVVPLSNLKKLPAQFITRLPFQAIACSLDGVFPKTGNGQWTEEANRSFKALTRDSDGYLSRLQVQVKLKEKNPDEVTNGPHYLVSLNNPEKSELKDLADSLISQDVAVKLAVETPAEAPAESKIAVNTQEPTLSKPTLLTSKLIEDDDLKFDVSADCMELVIKSLQTSTKPQSEIDTGTRSIRTNEQFSPPSRTNKKLTLIDYALPLKDSKSLFPTTKWSQNDKEIFLTFFVKPAESYKLEFKENHISFTMDVEKTRYELHTNTYGNIIPHLCSHKKVDIGIKVTLRKQDTSFTWNRLIQSPKSQSWLTRDFSTWLSGFESEEEKEQEPLITPSIPKYAFEDEQFDSTSSSSDEECPDEMWMRDDDN